MLKAILLTYSILISTAHGMTQNTKLVCLYSKKLNETQKKHTALLFDQAEKRSSEIKELNGLIDNGALTHSYRDTHKSSLLLVASEHGNLAMVRWLLQKGFKIDLNRSLYYSVSANIHNEADFNEISEELIKHGADINAGNGEIFRWVISRGNERLFNIFTQNPSLDVYAKNQYFGETALNEAVQYGRTLMFDRLVIMHKNPITQNEKDFCLKRAALEGHLVIVKKLLVLGASMYSGAYAGDKLGEAWRLARDRGHTQITAWFEKVYEQDVKNKKPEAVDSLYYIWKSKGLS